MLDDPTGTPITAATALTALRDPADLVTPLLANGNVITVDGIKRGGRDVPSASFTVGTTGTTVGDLLSWLDDVIGIDTSAGVAGSPGVAVTARRTAGDRRQCRDGERPDDRPGHVDEQRGDDGPVRLHRGPGG